MGQLMCRDYKFQSTLPRKERLNEEKLLLICNNFNPRSHARSDSDAVADAALVMISIHAPTQGATAKLHRFHTRKFYFTSKFYTIRLKITILSGQIIFFLVSLSNFPLLSGANLPGNLCSLHIRTWPYPEFTRRLSHPDITLHYFLFYFIINNERFPDIFLSSSSSHSNLPIPSIIRFVFHSFKIPIESNTQTTKAHTDTDINAR